MRLSDSQLAALSHLCRRINQMYRNSVSWRGMSHPEWHTWKTIHALARRGLVEVEGTLVHVTEAGARIGLENGWLSEEPWRMAEQRRRKT